MGRVHRAVRRHGICRDPRAGQRLSRPKSISRTGSSSRRAICCSSSIRAPTRRRSRRRGRSSPEARRQVELATRQLGRTAELRKKDFEPASAYDQRVSDLKVASAAVRSAKAAIRSAELNVGFTRITAPLTGRISNHQVSIGNLVSGSDSATTPAMTTIVSLDPIYFYFDMSEGDYLAYQRATAAGMLNEARETTPPVYARLTDETEWPRKGQLNFLDNQMDRGAGTIRARADLREPGLFRHARAVRADPHPGLAAARRRS